MVSLPGAEAPGFTPVPLRGGSCTARLMMARERAHNIGGEILKGLRKKKKGEVEELARFWDTHEITEFEGQLEEVAEPVFQKRVIPRSEPEE